MTAAAERLVAEDAAFIHIVVLLLLLEVLLVSAAELLWVGEVETPPSLK